MKLIIYNPRLDTLFFSDKVVCLKPSNNQFQSNVFVTNIFGDISYFELWHVFPNSIIYLSNNTSRSYLMKKDIVEDIEVYILNDNEISKFASLYNSYVSFVANEKIEVNSDWHVFTDISVGFNDAAKLSFTDIKNMIKYLHNK